jgi:hypothetical protein
MLLPLTLEEALNDCTLGPIVPHLRIRKSLRCLPPLKTPPSTPIKPLSFLLHEESPLEKPRSSIGSDASPPGMVDDHSGISDSDADLSFDDENYQEAIDRIWSSYDDQPLKNNLQTSMLSHQPCYPEFDLAPLQPRAYKPTSSPKTSRPSTSPKPQPSPLAFGGVLTPVPNTSILDPLPTPRRRQLPGPLPEIQMLGPLLHRSPAQRSPGHKSVHSQPDTSKTLPSPPPSTQHIYSTFHIPQPARTRSSSHPNQYANEAPPPPLPRPSLTLRPRPSLSSIAYHNQSYQIRPQTAHAKSAFSVNATLPLTPEKSVFEYDSDDETRAGKNGGSPGTTLASRLHMRSISMGSRKPGSFGKAAGMAVVEGTQGKRKRSATQVVMSVFGLGKK